MVVWCFGHLKAAMFSMIGLGFLHIKGVQRKVRERSIRELSLEAFLFSAVKWCFRSAKNLKYLQLK